MSNDQNTIIAENSYQEGYDKGYRAGKETGREEFNKREFKAGLLRAAEIANHPHELDLGSIIPKDAELYQTVTITAMAISNVIEKEAQQL